MRLDGKRVVVIGGSSGIGLETARLALSLGAYVTIAGRSEDHHYARIARFPDSLRLRDWHHLGLCHSFPWVMNGPEVLSCLLRASGGLDVSPEFLPHGGEYFFRESVLLSRTEAYEQCGGQNIHRNCLFNCRLDGPTPFP